MAKITPPIFVLDDFDILMFDSIEKAEQTIEPIDVKGGNFEAYDAHGRLLKLEASTWRVTIKALDAPNDPTKLTATLRAYLRASNDPAADDPSCDLQCLVNACRKYL